MQVFLSYRSKDTPDEAKQIHRYLENLNIGLEPFEFRRSMTAGDPWKEEIDKNLLRSDVLIALIGPKWLDLLRARDPEGDMVRYEIGKALERPMRVIPLLVAAAEMPEPDQLPKDLEALAKCTPIHGNLLNDDVLEDLKEQICRVKNWVIVSQLSPFTAALRDALEKRSDKLGIVRFPKFEKSADEHHDEYPQWLYKFMREAPKGSWLFTNYAEDDRKQISEPDEDRLIDDLSNQSKRMICFESGHNLWARARERVREAVNPISVIETNADHAIKQLIRHMTTHVWRKQEQIEIVSVMGPRAANTEERGRKYLEFFGCVQHGMKTDAYDKVCRTLGTKVLCTTVTRPLPTWLAEDCRPEIIEFLKLRKPENKSVHTTFVCGNDDLAVIVYNAVHETFAADVQEGRVSFVGFDGMPCMVDLKKTLGARAATAYVNFDAMVDVALEWLKTGKMEAKPFPVSALGKC